jgi:CheY-like chemotaxis protein
MILDLKMDGMGGMEVLRRVRKCWPDISTIILSGHGNHPARKKAAELGASDFLEKPADIPVLVEKIKTVFAEKSSRGAMFSYGRLVVLLQNHLDAATISLGENGLGIKCFCRDDNQDRLGYLLTNIGRSGGWFDLNTFGAYPAGRSLDSFGPPSHHIPELPDTPSWTVVFHATHVGCDSQYTLGMTDRYGMRRPSTSCGLVAAILNRHEDRLSGKKVPVFQDFEMAETEKALMPHLDEIKNSDHPMAAGAEKLYELGQKIFDVLLRTNGKKSLYIGGINVDCDAAYPQNNLFVPKKFTIYKDPVQLDLELNCEW